jgi:hypothetical protein
MQSHGLCYSFDQLLDSIVIQSGRTGGTGEEKEENDDDDGRPMVFFLKMGARLTIYYTHTHTDEYYLPPHTPSGVVGLFSSFSRADAYIST